MTKQTKEQHSALVQNFAELGRTEIPQVQLGEVEENIENVFVAYPTRYFTQQEFVQVLGKSNARINRALHKLMSSNVCTRIGSKSRYFYIKIQ